MNQRKRLKSRSDKEVNFSNLQGVPYRILVTGSRAKSSLVRLLHTVFAEQRFSVRSRVTGVIPRELFPGGERAIRRTSPGHVREMEWWASQIDPSTDVVIMENSAVAPELQSLAAQILEPTLVVWTNCRPDHEEVWGPGRDNAVQTLIGGIPSGVPVACGGDIDPSVKVRLERLGNKTLPPLTLPPEYGELPRHSRENMELAAAVCHVLGLPLDRALRAMAELPPDIADFRVLEHGCNKLAVAFSANDPISTAGLFESVGWSPHETTLLFHHRTDRPARLQAFAPWIHSLPWKQLVFTRNTRPCRFLSGARFFKNDAAIDWNDGIADATSFQKFWDGQVFGCGNVAGWPLDFLLSPQRGEV